MTIPNKDEIYKEALERTEFLALSTFGEEGTWTNPVSFAYDGEGNLFFISQMHTKHVKNISKNAGVSLAIYSTNRFPDGDILGLQIKGKCYHLESITEIAKATWHYFSRNTNKLSFEKFTNSEGNMEALWHFFKIIPEETWILDTRNFGEDRVLYKKKEI
jgi:uncharacterized protein YhbP (UPF0306 family)